MFTILRWLDPRTNRLALALVVAAGVLTAAHGAEPQALSKLDVVTADGRRLAFQVEVATTQESRSRGLMYRRSLPADGGMLFDFAAVDRVYMWMKNTLIPLDMVFLAADGRIIGIAERTVPLSLETIGSPGPAAGVLEVNGGTAARLGIHVGDRVEHPLFAAKKP